MNEVEIDRGSVSGTRETQNESRQGEMNLSDLGIIKWAYFENEQNPQLEGKSSHLTQFKAII